LKRNESDFVATLELPKDEQGGSLVLGTLHPNNTLPQPSLSTSKTKLAELLIEDEEKTEKQNEPIQSTTTKTTAATTKSITTTTTTPTNIIESPNKAQKIIPPLNLYYTPSQPEFDEKPISPPKPIGTILNTINDLKTSANLTNSGNVNNNNNNNLTNSANKQASPSVVR